MATTNTRNSAIFNRLDELFPSSDFIADSSNPTSEQNREAKAIAANTSDKAYRKLTAAKNVTSYSKLLKLHECPRAFELDMYEKSKPELEVAAFAPQENLDFAYGHAVGSGIQAYAATGNLQAAQFAAFIAWKAPWDAEKVDKRGVKSGKSLNWALYAVEKFASFWASTFEEWEVLKLPSGKLGVELEFAVDTGDGFTFVGHIDVVLRHKTSGRLAVWEGKTQGSDTVDEATHGNSYQALGYSVVVDAISTAYGLPQSDYEVYYIVYSSKTKEFTLLPFTKNLTQRAEWLQSILLDHAMITKYFDLGFFPKRGANCVNKYGRRCFWYGACGLRNESIFPGVEPSNMESTDELVNLDFKFTLSELIAAQRNRKPNET